MFPRTLACRRRAGFDAATRIQPRPFLRFAAGRDHSTLVSKSAGKTADLLAQVDTGASNCDVEAGDPKTFATAAGRIDAFGHVVELEVLGQRFESMVYFFADDRIQKNLLGRVGWLDRVRLGVVDHDHLLYLAAYDFEAR